MPKKKPSPKKKRAAPQAVESHQRKQERLEARRRAKEQALIAQRKQERRARVVRTVAIAAALTAIVWLVFLRETSPDAIAGNEIQTFSTSNGGQQQSHAAPYTYEPATTGVNPPVSGKHDPNPAECGIHTEKIPDENFVHSLEHGAVAVVYNPKQVELGEIRKIEDIVMSYDDDTLSAPYPGLEDPIVMASWSRKMPLDDFDDDAIREYIDTFRDTEPAPEASVADCDKDADDPYEQPEPTPGSAVSPPPGDDQGAADEDGKGGGGKGGGDDTGDAAGDSKMEKEEEGN